MIKQKINWDALGITASLACAIHCAILPLVLTSLPIFGINIIDNFSFEVIMIFLAFCIGAYSLYHGWKKHHHSKQPIIMFTVGILLLLAKQIWHQYQFYFLVPAVLLIITAHITNYRSCRVHNHAHEDDCDH
jgi:MerC mercury resistance protein